MQEWLLDIFHWLPGGAVFVVAVFVVALFEALVGIGLIMPGSVLTVFSGWLAFQGKAPIATIMVSAGSGAICGDMISYWLGARYGTHLWNWPYLNKHKGLIRLANLFFLEHGGKSIFLGRFLGPIRGVVPFVAGASQMRPRAFSLYAIISGLLWGISYPGVGFLGGTSWERAESLAGRIGILFSLGLIVAFALLWLRRRYLPKQELREAKKKNRGDHREDD